MLCRVGGLPRRDNHQVLHGVVQTDDLPFRSSSILGATVIGWLGALMVGNLVLVSEGNVQAWWEVSCSNSRLPMPRR